MSLFSKAQILLANLTFQFFTDSTLTAHCWIVTFLNFNRLTQLLDFLVTRLNWYTHKSFCFCWILALIALLLTARTLKIVLSFFIPRYQRWFTIIITWLGHIPGFDSCRFILGYNGSLSDAGSQWRPYVGNLRETLYSLQNKLVDILIQ